MTPSTTKREKRKRLKRYLAENPFRQLESLLVVATDSYTFKEQLVQYGQLKFKNQKLHPSALFA